MNVFIVCQRNRIKNGIVAIFQVTETDLTKSQLPTLKEIIAQARKMFWANKTTMMRNVTTLSIESGDSWIWLENQKSFQEIVDNTLTIKRNAANKTLTMSTSQSTIYGTRSNTRRTKEGPFNSRPRTKYQRTNKRRRQRIYILGSRRQQKKKQNETTVSDMITTTSTSPELMSSSSLSGFFITKNPDSIIETTAFVTSPENNPESSVSDEIITTTNYFESRTDNPTEMTSTEDHPESRTQNPSETLSTISQLETTERSEFETKEKTTLSDSISGTTEMPNITLKEEEKDGISDLTVQSSSNLQDSREIEFGLRMTRKSGSIEAKEGKRSQKSNRLPNKDDHQVNSEVSPVKARPTFYKASSLY